MKYLISKVKTIACIQAQFKSRCRRDEQYNIKPLLFKSNFNYNAPSPPKICLHRQIHVIFLTLPD